MPADSTPDTTLKTRLLRLAPLCLALACGEASSQSQDLPNALSGRWTWTQRDFSQTFSLDEIKTLPDRTFTAKLTWWTINPRCAIRGEPIVGKQIPSGLAFEATTKCDTSFSAELVRAQAGWVGKATTTNGPAVVVVDLKAD